MRRTTSFAGRPLNRRTILKYCLSSGLSAAPAVRGLAAGNDLNDIRPLVERLLAERHEAGLGLVIVKNDKVVLLEGYGARNALTRAPVTPDTQFALGSGTKAFAALGATLLATDGKLDLDAPVSARYPNFQLSDPAATAIVSTRDLLCHRSGLPGHDLVWYDADKTPAEEIVRRMRYLEMNGAPRSLFQYNNLGYIAAGGVVARAAGTTWESFIAARLLRPLGMNNATISVAEAEKQDNRADPHLVKDGRPQLVARRVLGAAIRAGGIHASPRELAAWIRIQLSGGMLGRRRIFPEAPLLLTHTRQMPMPDARLPGNPDAYRPNYALGLISDMYRGHACVHHTGSIDGYHCHMLLFPQDSVGVFALANTDASVIPEIAALSVSDRLLELVPVDWSRSPLFAPKARKSAPDQPTATTSEATPALIAGTYRHPAYDDMVVSDVSDGVALKWRHLDTPLIRRSSDSFETAGRVGISFGPLTLAVMRNDDGKVTGLSSTLEPKVKPQRFARIDGAAVGAGH